MRMLKKYALFLFCALLLLSLTACQTGGNTKRDADKEKSSSTQTSFRRLDSVTIQREGEEAVTYHVNWNNDSCTFVTDDFEDGVLATFDNQVFSIEFTNSGGGKTILPIVKFDDDEKIVLIYNEDDPTETFDVTYDENGLPVWEMTEAQEYYQYDEATGTVRVKAGSGSTGDNQGNILKKYTNYEVRTLDEWGNIRSVDMLTITEYSDGTTEEKLKENEFTYEYDEDGNLLSLTVGRSSYTFTYTNEKIHHTWERMIPVAYLDFFYWFDYPLFWNVK